MRSECETVNSTMKMLDTHQMINTISCKWLEMEQERLSSDQGESVLEIVPQTPRGTSNGRPRTMRNQPLRVTDSDQYSDNSDDFDITALYHNTDSILGSWGGDACLSQDHGNLSSDHGNASPAAPNRDAMSIDQPCMSPSDSACPPFYGDQLPEVRYISPCGAPSYPNPGRLGDNRREETRLEGLTTPQIVPSRELLTTHRQQASHTTQAYGDNTAQASHTTQGPGTRHGTETIEGLSLDRSQHTEVSQSDRDESRSRMDYLLQQLKQQVVSINKVYFDVGFN